MLSLGFTISVFDHFLYFKDTTIVPIFLLLYVDDMLISLCLKSINHVQNCLNQDFDMTDLGDAKTNPWHEYFRI